MSQKVEEVYSFVNIYLQQHRFSPSIREIAAGCYMSTGSVFYYLAILQAQGRLIRESGKSRSLKLRNPNI